MQGTHNIQRMAPVQRHNMVKLPLIPLYVVTQNFGHMPESNHMSTVHFGKFTQLRQDFYFKDNGPEACTVTLENRMSIPLPKFVVNWLQPIWQRFSTKWFIATWEEDLPMRLRRWKVLKLGFRDFVGIDYYYQFQNFHLQLHLHQQGTNCYLLPAGHLNCMPPR